MTKHRNASPATLLGTLAFTAALTLTVPAAAQSPTGNIEAPSPRLELLLKGGAYDLALDRVNRLQDDAGNDLKQWLEWERLRYELYRGRGDWEELAERLLNLPPEVPEIQRHGLMTHAAELLVDAGRGDQAREILRALIWRSSGDSKQLNYWRRLVVRSYLVAGMDSDAGIAMSLYEREYLPRDADWDYLFAQVLLREGDARTAAQRLGSAQEPAARVLRLLARLRAGIDEPRLVIANSGQLRNDLPDQSPLKAVSWAITAEAAAQAGAQEVRVEALEQLFNGPALPAEFGLFDLTVADLWQAYEDLGTRLGNEQNLLFGDPAPWLSLAQSLKGEGSALRARAIVAAAARNTPASQAGPVHVALYDRMYRFELVQLAVRLYEPSPAYPTVERVPEAIRHRIVADAIEEREMAQAARFARGLTAPPASAQSQLQWDLTRARLAIFGGDFEQSEAIMNQVVKSRPSFEQATADQVMQPIFDLQSVGRGDVAYDLFRKMYERVETNEQRREILVWMGDAKQAENEYGNAAEYYLRSAYSGPGPRDEWGQSARYRAAEALTEAQLYEDARRVYEQLLTEVGEGSKRSAALQRRLQELWIKKQESN